MGPLSLPTPPFALKLGGIALRGEGKQPSEGRREAMQMRTAFVQHTASCPAGVCRAVLGPRGLESRFYKEQGRMRASPGMARWEWALSFNLAKLCFH